MRFAALLIALGLAGAAALSVPAQADRDQWSFTTNIDGDVKNMTCADIDMAFWKKKRGDVPNVRRDQTIAISQAASTPLRIVSTNGGVRVQPSTDGSYSAVICQVAAADTRAEADATLDRIQASYTGSELRVNGPDHLDWSCYVILNVPKSAVLNLSAENGGLCLRDVEGTFDLRTENGPISLIGVSGTVDARAQNGPIDIKGHSGDIELTCENGPVGVQLDQATWEGRGLTASTQNGPIVVEMPKNVRTGVRVEGTDQSPIKWGGWSGDHWGIDDDGSSKVFRFGSEPTKVRVSTVNGPIEIKALGARTTKGGKRI